MMRTRKGQAISLQNLGIVVVMFAVAVLVTVFTSDIVTDIGADQTANSAAKNVSTKGEAGMVNLSGQYGNVGTVIGAALIIGILVAIFAFRGKR